MGVDTAENEPLTVESMLRLLDFTFTDPHRPIEVLIGIDMANRYRILDFDGRELFFAGEVQDIELYGPFGGGRVQIDANPEGARLEDTKGRVITGNSTQEVLEIRLGWHVPFDELVFWSRGLPGEEAKDITIDDQGRLKSFNQGIWQVEYTEYRQTGAYTLPRKINITSLPGNLEIYDDDGNYIGDELSVKVILKKWLDLGLSS